MHNIEPHAMACFTQTGTTDDDHKQFAFHECILFDETETVSIKAADIYKCEGMVTPDVK